MKKTNRKLNFFTVLLLFALVPVIVVTTILSTVLINVSSGELEKATNNSLVTTVSETGNAFDYSTEITKQTMESFISAPIVLEYLKNPEDAELAAKAQQYTVDFFAELDGWEGIYLADWNSKVLTHPAPPVVGRVMREGERLAELQNAMLSADGVYNVGIIISPASGNLIMSLYAPIYDGDTPIGYVGAGTYVNNIAAKFSDVSALGLSTAYTYFVGPDGTMLYHPDESKIGNPVENAAVKEIIARLDAGETLTPGCIEYEYKGATKYAAFYVGENNHYIAVLTADKADALSAENEVKLYTVIIAIVLVAVFSGIALIISRKISKPLAGVAYITKELSHGNVNVDIDIETHMAETVDIKDAAISLQNALKSSIGEVKITASNLDETIIAVNDKTNSNADRVSEINMAVDEVARTSSSVAENAQSMSDQANYLGSAIDTLTYSIEGLKESADLIARNNDSSAKQVEIVMQSSKESVEAVNDITTRIAETNEAIQSISNCVAVIEEISSQTNLLALNASIEAARAGDAGRGFAVVAEEIRKLADSSAQSSQQIKHIIENVTKMSVETVASAAKVSDITLAEQDHISDTQKKFIELSGAVNASLDQISSIKEMADSLDEIKGKLVNATIELGAISEELGASAEEVSSACHIVAESCDETRALAEEMQQYDYRMLEAIDFFKI